MLKFGTIIDWTNAWKYWFYLLKIFLFEPLGPFLALARAKSFRALALA